MSTSKYGGEQRKFIYKMVENIIDRELSKEEQSALRTTLKAYANAGTENYQQKITKLATFITINHPDVLIKDIYSGNI